MIIKIKVKVKGSGKNPLPDWGLGEGILIEQEVEFNEEGLPAGRIAAGLDEIYQELLKQVIEPVYEPNSNRGQ